MSKFEVGQEVLCISTGWTRTQNGAPVHEPIDPKIWETKEIHHIEHSDFAKSGIALFFKGSERIGYCSRFFASINERTCKKSESISIVKISPVVKEVEEVTDVPVRKPVKIKL